MNNQPIDFRSINSRSELEDVYEVLGGIFAVGRDFFQQRLDHDSTYDPATTWIGVQDDKITSTMQVFPLQCQAHQAGLKIGGIGSVATVPDYRGLGHSKQLLHRLTNWMEEEEYDLSLLFAVITPFYEQVGWTVVPEVMYEWDTSFVRQDELNSSTGSVKSKSEYTIVPFQPSDLSSLAHIYSQFNRDRACTVIRTDTYWKDLMSWPRWTESSCLLVMRDGVPVAYGVISNVKQDGAVYLNELCYLQGSEDAVVPLFQSLIALRPEAERVIANLPDDHALLEHLLSWGAVEKPMLYAMWKIIRLQPMLAKMTKAFEARLQSYEQLANSSFQFILECAGQQAYFHYDNGQLSIEPAEQANYQYSHLQLSQGELVSLIMQGYDNTFKLDRDARQAVERSEQLHHLILQVLFPEQGYVFYHLDKF